MFRTTTTSWTIIAVIGAFCAGARAEEIRGTITVQRRLTKRRVSAGFGLYDRGPVVELQPDPEQDPLAAERGSVVIYLDGPAARHPVTAMIEQKDRKFVPDLLTIPVGSTVSFPNLDPIFHSVFSLSKPKTFALGNYPKDHTRTVTFPKAGVVFVNCHLHTNVNAAIVVTPNRWATIAARNGAYELRDVPPGRYNIVAWHRSTGALRQHVDVAPEHGAVVDFVVPLTDSSPGHSESH